MKLVNQQVIKNTNMKRLYTSIYSSPGISRAHLAKQTKLSKTTVSTLVDELIERGIHCGQRYRRIRQHRT